MTELPAWFGEFYEGGIENSSRASLKVILFGRMLDLLKDRDFETMDVILSSLNWQLLSPVMMMGAVRVLYPAREFLTHWQPAVKSVCAELTRRGMNTTEIMRGLLNDIETKIEG